MTNADMELEVRKIDEYFSKNGFQAAKFGEFKKDNIIKHRKAAGIRATFELDPIKERGDNLDSHAWLERNMADDIRKGNVRDFYNNASGADISQYKTKYFREIGETAAELRKNDNFVGINTVEPHKNDQFVWSQYSYLNDSAYREMHVAHESDKHNPRNTFEKALFTYEEGGRVNKQELIQSYKNYQNALVETKDLQVDLEQDIKNGKFKDYFNDSNGFNVRNYKMRGLEGDSPMEMRSNISSYNSVNKNSISRKDLEIATTKDMYQAHKDNKQYPEKNKMEEAVMMYRTGNMDRSELINQYRSFKSSPEYTIDRKQAQTQPNVKQEQGKPQPVPQATKFDTIRADDGRAISADAKEIKMGSDLSMKLLKMRPNHLIKM